MTSMLFFLSLLSCSEPAAPPPPDRLEFAVDKSQDAPTEIVSIPLPTRGARLFLRKGGTITLTTTHNESIAVEHTLEVGAGMIYTDDAQTLRGTEGVFEFNLNTWKSDSPARDSQVKSHFFDIVNNPVAFVDLTEITTLAEPLEINESVETTVNLTLLLAGIRTDVEMDVRIQHKDNAYRFYSDSPQPLLLSKLQRNSALLALVKACGIANFNDKVMVALDLEMDWSGSGGMHKIPRPPPQLTTKITGENAVKPTKKRDRDLNRDVKKDPKPHDLRKGNVQWKMRGQKKEKLDDQPFE